MYKVESIAKIKEVSPKFNVVSLFAGGGGSSLGYRMAGGKVLLINEFVKEARKTYSSNWPDTRIIPDDIRKITGSDILKEIGMEKLEIDILDGSPPCSAFSVAGKKNKGWGDAQKKYSDVSQRNVEDLFFEYIRVLKEIAPKVFVAENVAGLTIGKAKGYLNQILRLMRSCGYHVEAKVLNAKWLGVPQSRNRLIIVGVHESIYKPEMSRRLHPKPHKSIVVLKEALAGLVFTEKDRIETSLKRFAVYKLLITLKRGQSHHKAFTLNKASPKLVSQCIKATTGKVGAREAYHWDNRAFTVSEIKRIMSVPDDYILTGDYSKQVERLGRMVPPKMMEAIARNIYTEVLSKC